MIMNYPFEVYKHIDSSFSGKLLKGQSNFYNNFICMKAEHIKRQAEVWINETNNKIVVSAWNMRSLKAMQSQIANLVTGLNQ